MRCGAVLKGEKDIQWGEWLYPAAVKVRNSPLWGQSGAGVKQQCAYLALKYWSRLYAPEVIMGVYTSDEIDERELKIINPETGGALDLGGEAESELVDIVDTDSGEVVENVDTATGEVVASFDDVMEAMALAEHPAALVEASNGATAFDKDSDEYKKIGEFYKAKMAKLKNGEPEQDTSAG